MAHRATELATLTPLRHRVLTAGFFTLANFSISTLARFGANLILTRLLYPEAFGLMAIVQAIIVGATLLSDLGIEQSIIYHKEGDTEEFLNSAWTINILRNTALWLLICALAFPIAKLYSSQEIAYILPVAGFSGVIGSFASTNLSIADRNLRVARATVLNLATSITGLALSIIMALITHSLWSLVVGTLFSSLARTVGSHIYLPGARNKLSWDHSSLTAMASYGRWIFVGSALTFLAGEGNRLLIGILVPAATLSFFNLAITIVQLPLQIAQQLGGKVFFAAYSEVARDRPADFNSILTRARLVQIIPHWCISVSLVAFGSPLIHLLYDQRYEDTGWILSDLAVGWLCGCLISSYSGALLAKGQAYYNTAILISQVVVQNLSLLVGFYIHGFEGLVIGYSISFWILYPVNALLYRRHGLWQPKIDIPFLLMSVIVTFALKMVASHAALH